MTKVTFPSLIHAGITERQNNLIVRSRAVNLTKLDELHAGKIKPLAETAFLISTLSSRPPMRSNRALFYQSLSSFSTSEAITPTLFTAALSCSAEQPNLCVQHLTS
jgi:hypothetical protein